MLDILSSIHIRLENSMYLKDPDSSELGKRILSGSIELIHDIGFDQFTFRKLSAHIKSTEASIYRYFESKHKLLLYLNAWYWSFMECQLAFLTTNVQNPNERLERAIRLITDAAGDDEKYHYINIGQITKIINDESLKIYLTKEVDEVNKNGAFVPYKQFVETISDIILEINPNYPYPHMLISTAIEGAHLQRFFGQHLPRLTDVKNSKDYLYDFYNEIIQKAIAQ